MEIGLALGAIALFLVIAAIITVKNLIVIVPPNQAAVITGRRSEDRTYKSIRGGRAIRIPIIEKVDYIPLTTMPLDIRVSNAYSKGNIPLAIQAVANVKVGWTPAEVFDNAIERLLPFSREAVEAQATETLAANLRGVLATMTPEEVNEDRLKFANELIEEADADLKRRLLLTACGQKHCTYCQVRRREAPNPSDGHHTAPPSPSNRVPMARPSRLRKYAQAQPPPMIVSGPAKRPDVAVAHLSIDLSVYGWAALCKESVKEGAPLGPPPYGTTP
jgi:hypothetical protein